VRVGCAAAKRASHGGAARPDQDRRGSGADLVREPREIVRIVEMEQVDARPARFAGDLRVAPAKGDADLGHGRAGSERSSFQGHSRTAGTLNAAAASGATGPSSSTYCFSWGMYGSSIDCRIVASFMRAREITIFCTWFVPS